MIIVSKNKKYMRRFLWTL